MAIVVLSTTDWTDKTDPKLRKLMLEVKNFCIKGAGNTVFKQIMNWKFGRIKYFMYFCTAVPVIPLPDSVLVKNPGFLFSICQRRTENAKMCHRPAMHWENWETGCFIMNLFVGIWIIFLVSTAVWFRYWAGWIRICPDGLKGWTISIKLWIASEDRL